MPRTLRWWLFSLARGFDASGVLGQGWCSTHNQQHSPSFVRVDVRELDIPRARTPKLAVAAPSPRNVFSCARRQVVTG